ncbi:FecR family protein [Abyssalbus ytuae]|uniref:DUF4974 domain-containing protein n=1 Tax=Abyssalbus ytuae TaxID=2926907 RepID=A0A9E6ZSB2_9FLAO|nr:FecR family protein [Abyssalbus ytuae]UOB17943.1 DUF4974 domain-containing protein [Abyssalbus ytuae]
MEHNDNIKQLLQKFLKDDCSQTEADQVIKYFQEAKQTADFPTVEDVLDLFQELPKIDEKASNKIIHNILKDTKPKVHMWHYGAAAIVISILAITYLFKSDIFSTVQAVVTPTIVNNQIKPGTNKATLTLEMGEVVTLTKGTTYQTSNATSNGEKLIYNNNPSHELAYNYLSVPRGGQFFLKLSDGTQIWLNSESQLKYPVHFIEGEPRQVELVYGEAYFDVSPSTQHKGAKFKVYHNQQEVQVLGTEFNIKAYKDETHIYTTLVEGKVAVSFENQNKILNPGEQLNVNAITKMMDITNVEIYDQVSWKEGVFSFKRKSLKEIMQVLSRWYDMKVDFENKELEKLGFNGVLGKEQDIQEILETIKNFGVIKNYEINNKEVILK